MDNLYDELSEKCPFLTIGRYLDNEYIGIVQNSDDQFLSMYCYDSITSPEMKKEFLKQGEVWWWESNRQIPINIFLGKPFKIFSKYLKTFVKKEFVIVTGPTVSLGSVIHKRVKRRQIQLVTKID